MALLSPPALPFTAGQPSLLRVQSPTSGRLSAPAPPQFRRRLQALYLPPRSNAPSIEQSKLSTSSFILFDPLLDGALSLLTLLRLLPPNFHQRWQHLFEIPEKEAEAWLARLPFHLIQAVTASEDHRFFSHYGVDLHGIARAVVRYPNGGGGSTITQQLVKRIFLTSERKLSRKFVEGVLSLLVERRISKWKILYSYMRKSMDYGDADWQSYRLGVMKTHTQTHLVSISFVNRILMWRSLQDCSVHCYMDYWCIIKLQQYCQLLFAWLNVIDCKG